jgi:hypothetical protein
MLDRFATLAVTIWMESAPCQCQPKTAALRAARHDKRSAIQIIEPGFRPARTERSEAILM